MAVRLVRGPGIQGAHGSVVLAVCGAGLAVDSEDIGAGIRGCLDGRPGGKEAPRRGSAVHRDRGDRCELHDAADRYARTGAGGVPVDGGRQEGCTGIADSIPETAAVAKSGNWEYHSPQCGN